MDLKILADTLTAVLAPAMPYLVSGGGELVKEAGKTLSEKAPEWIKELWAKLRPKVDEKPSATEAVQDVAKAPDDADAQASLRLQLRKILEADASFAAEIAKLLEAAGPKISNQAALQGSGAIAQDGSVAAGADGKAAGGSITITSPK